MNLVPLLLQTKNTLYKWKTKKTIQKLNLKKLCNKKNKGYKCNFAVLSDFTENKSNFHVLSFFFFLQISLFYTLE